MSQGAVVLETVDQETEDEDLVHWTCCNPEIGLCGSKIVGPDLTDMHVPEEDVCIVCDKLDQFYRDEEGDLICPCKKEQ